MTETQYNECKKYEGIINLFVSSGQYIGGLDGLMDFYSFKDRRCSTCVAAFIVEREIEMRKYAKK